MPKGIWLSFIAFAAYSISDACAKAMHGALPPYEMGFFGALLSLLLLPVVWRGGTTAADLVVARRQGLWLLRGALSVVSTLTSVVAFTYLTMAEAFSLIFIMPLVTTVLSVGFLKERVTPAAWLAILLGFIGVLIVLRPGFRDIGIGQWAGLACGVSGSCLTVLLRYVGHDEKPMTQFGAAQLFPLAAFALLSAGHFVAPRPVQWLIIAGYAVLAAAGNLLLTFAGRLVPASRLAPTQYSQMVWGTAFGWLFFADRVDGLTFAGIAVIVGAGLWLFLPKRTPAGAVR